jgi:hypothetical protein
MHKLQQMIRLRYLFSVSFVQTIRHSIPGITTAVIHGPHTSRELTAAVHVALPWAEVLAAAQTLSSAPSATEHSTRTDIPISVHAPLDALISALRALGLDETAQSVETLVKSQFESATRLHASGLNEGDVSFGTSGDARSSTAAETSTATLARPDRQARAQAALLRPSSLTSAAVEGRSSSSSGNGLQHNAPQWPVPQPNALSAGWDDRSTVHMGSLDHEDDSGLNQQSQSREFSVFDGDLRGDRSDSLSGYFASKRGGGSGSISGLSGLPVFAQPPAPRQVPGSYRTFDVHLSEERFGGRVEHGGDESFAGGPVRGSKHPNPPNGRGHLRGGAAARSGFPSSSSGGAGIDDDRDRLGLGGGEDDDYMRDVPHPSGRMNDPARNPVYKTQLCKHWQKFGWCKFGAACGYAHGVTELRAASSIIAPHIITA